MPEPVKTARAVPPNAGISAWYARNLTALARQMAKATERDVLSGAEGAFNSADPSAWLEAIFSRRASDLDKAARLIAKNLGRKMTDYTRRNVTAALKEAGFIIEMRLTARETAEMQNVIQKNVDLIKKIPEQYQERVREAVGESFAKGRDLHGLGEALKKVEGLSPERAAMIARDQTNKATEGLTRARYQEMGITRAIWMHRPSAKKPRPTHEAMYMMSFDLNEGLFDPEVGRNILPGELPNCHCTMRPILPRPTPPADPVFSGAISAATVMEKAA
jgi:uncharacterized protein with gpF-like domain